MALSTGEIIGISIGGFILVVLLILLIRWAINNEKTTDSEPCVGGSGRLFSEEDIARSNMYRRSVDDLPPASGSEETRPMIKAMNIRGKKLGGIFERNEARNAANEEARNAAALLDAEQPKKRFWWPRGGKA